VLVAWAAAYRLKASEGLMLTISGIGPSLIPGSALQDAGAKSAPSS
jgi:hypothetical protein